MQGHLCLCMLSVYISIKIFIGFVLNILLNALSPTTSLLTATFNKISLQVTFCLDCTPFIFSSPIFKPWDKGMLNICFSRREEYYGRWDLIILLPINFSVTIHLLSLDGKGSSFECMKVVILCTKTYTFLKLGVFSFDIVTKEYIKFIATLAKFLAFFLNCWVQTHPWVVSL